MVCVIHKSETPEYTMYKKQSEKAVETRLDDVAEEILAKVESAGQLKESR